MSDSFFTAITFLAALGSAVAAGVFFAFSTFVMKALARLPATEGIAAMQAINITVINPLFMGVFLGTGVACVALIVGAVLHWERPGTGWLIAGGAFYLIESIIFTILFNVPLNDSLATLNSTDPTAAEVWTSYVSHWTLWNHVRTINALAAAASFVIAWRR